MVHFDVSRRPASPACYPLLGVILVVCVIVGVSSVDAADPATTETTSTKLDAPTLEFVTTKVQPLLRARCLECHGDQKEPKGELRLDSRAAMLIGGESGPALSPGSPEKSLMIESINWRGDFEMPEKKKLPPGEIAILTKWVEMGAPWPEGEQTIVAPKVEFPLQKRRASHWAWRPVPHRTLPKIQSASWPKQDLDYFVLSKLESAKLTPAAPATRQTLIRRVTFDLIGLPPTPQEVEAFVTDKASTDDALSTVVDRLLASPHFGERWARHWLDLMRYAESRGHEFDHTAANAYHYRDYLIRAYNADLPYDRFVIEHIAGDLLKQPRLHQEKQFNESVLATGFWYMGEWVHSPTDILQDEADRFDGVIDTVGKAFLGMTISCARCHDHKFDAISAKDYYALAGYLQSSRYRQVRFDSMVHNEQVAQKLWKLRADHQAQARSLVGKSLQPGLANLSSSLLALSENTVNGEAPKFDALASKYKLDAILLERLYKHLEAVRKDKTDPLHCWAVIVFDKGQSEKGELLTATTSLAKQVQEDNAKISDAWKDIRVVADYTTLPDNLWIQDGFAFGSGPQRPGHLLLNESPTQPLAGVATYGAAVRDQLWSGLKSVGGTQNESGALGKVQRPGQTLCTPTFTVESGTLQYLIRGSAKVQAVVDSHRLIAGPLHGALIRSVKAGDAPQWVSHPLDRYIGHRAHLEFVPDANFELLMVADTKSRPPVPQPGQTWAGIFADKNISSTKLLANAFGELLATTHQKLSSSAAMTSDDARLANWMVKQRQLFVADDTLNQQIADLTSRFELQQKDLASQIRRESRTAMAIADAAGEDERLHIRGRSNNQGETVPRRLIEAIAGAKAQTHAQGSGRLQLANQMVDAKQNPLIARVYVNRIWLHLLGEGVVPTPNNFGVLGRPPSNIELLDHLAETFVKEGWSTKKLIQRIVTSQTYQMSSMAGDKATETQDPNNVLLHRMSVRRLGGEAIRDSMLAISGRLDRKLEGPATPVNLTAFMTGRGRPGNGPLDGAGRRSIYTSVRRNFLSPMMLSFDVPIPTQSIGRRNVSNVPSQALILMNDPFVRQQAELWAKNILSVPKLTPPERVAAMYQDALARQPTTDEVADSLEFVKQQTVSLGSPVDQWPTHAAAWSDLGHVLWNTKEFIFID